MLSVNSGCTVLFVPFSRDASIVWRSRLARKGNKSFGLSVETLHRCIDVTVAERCSSPRKC
jgi:hypothetical protein